LLTNLKGKADSTNQPALFSWDEISQLTNNPINYDLFKKEFDANPGLQQLIKRFSADGIELKTKVDADQGPEVSAERLGQNSVSKMAKRATRKKFGKSFLNR